MSSATDDRVDAIVIGAGISGLAAATELAKAGCRTIVLEKSRGIGGRMSGLVDVELGEERAGGEFETAERLGFEAVDGREAVEVCVVVVAVCSRRVRV